MRIFTAIICFLLCIGSAYAQGSPVADIWVRAANGGYPGISMVNLSGINPGNTTTFEPVWEESAAYAPQVSALVIPYCASSSTDDDGDPVGTGARTITVTGLNTSFEAFSETLTMNGTTSVPLTTSNILMFNSIEVITAGSGGVNAGIIQCGTGTNTSGDPAVTHAYLPVSSSTAIPGAGVGGGNKSMGFIYGVPASHTLVCRNISAGCVTTGTTAALYVAIDGYTNLGIMKRFFSQAMHNIGTNPSVTPALLKFPEKTIVIGKMAGISATGPVSLQAECLLIKNAGTGSIQSLF